jgi:hypothetical protein
MNAWNLLSWALNGALGIGCALLIFQAITVWI